MSDVFGNSLKDFQYIEEINLLKAGISFSLNEFYKLLIGRGIFLPGGQCSHVHLGGHVQTGGYGMITRAFGLLSDYVEGFDIVLADEEAARLVTIWKPNRYNKELLG